MARQGLKVLVVQAGRGPDYLADMISHYLYNTASLGSHVSTNKHPLYLFDDYPRDTPLYGRGFTVYRQIPADQRSRIRLHGDAQHIADAIRSRHYDLIVWTSVRRCSAYIVLAMQSGYGREQLIAVDGEDDDLIVGLDGTPLSELARLYKRELTAEAERRGVLPISFKFPAQHRVMRDTPKPKTQVLAACDPRFKASYVYESETAYYSGYQSSLFAFTTQKAGWDCCRHYEILACNCIPIFPGFVHLPTSTMKEWSRALQLEANDLWAMFSSLHDRSIDHHLQRWNSLNQRFQSAFRERMLTDSYQDVLGF